jgi:hypothetical protein
MTNGNPVRRHILLCCTVLCASALLAACGGAGGGAGGGGSSGAGGGGSPAGSTNSATSTASSSASSTSSAASAATSSAASTSAASGSAANIMPLEILGQPGTTASAQFNLSGSPASATTLKLTTHRLAWREDGEFAMKFNGAVRPGSKGSVRLNGGPWVGLTNSTVTCEAHEAQFGCLNGTYMTVRVRLPVSALGSPGLKSTGNTLDFRFDATDGISSGWRVLAIDVTNGSSSLIPAGTFVDDNPDSWTAPLPGASDIASGKTLWESAPLTDKGFSSSTHAINGKCASCHARDGYDLKYFNYSNKSIITRSTFHGLSETQGKQIASYIRSLPSGLPTGTTIAQAGRPWNPPYQPGPGLDSKPVELWSAGAGIGAVLESDSQMKAYMFPGGSYDAGRLGASGFLNPRETPQALQFVDWNAWLPTIALEDMVSDPAKLVPFAGSTPPPDNQQNPLDMLKISLQWLDSYRNTNMETDDWYLRHGLFTLYRWASSRWPGTHQGIPGEVSPSDALGNSRHALARDGWYNVRLWEIMKKYRLEALTHRTGLNIATDGVSKRGIPTGFRSWSMPLRTVFETAPHFVGPNTNVDASYGSNFVFSKPGEYLTTAWYSIEQVINGGWRSGSAGIDWNYHPQHLGGMHWGGTGYYKDGPMHPYRWAWSIIWMYQTRPADWVPSTMGASTGGFMQRQIGLGLEIPFMDEAESAGQITLTERKQLQEALALAFLGVAERYTPDQWMRRPVDDDANRSSGTFETVNYVANYNPAWAYDLPERGYQADAYYLRIKTLKDRGYVTNSTLTRLVNWAQGVWPNGNWNVLRP